MTPTGCAHPAAPLDDADDAMSTTPPLREPAPEAPASAAVDPFRFDSHVFLDELDPLGVLHNSRYSVHVEHAVAAFFESRGFHWEDSIEDNPDRLHVVRRFEIDMERPFRRTGILRVELWLEKMGQTSMTYGFACLSPDGHVCARGTRLVVKLDPTTRKPAEWTTRFRNAHETALPVGLVWSPG